MRNIEKLLLVDDDPNILFIAEMGLEDTPEWTVITAQSGREAIENAIREQPDAIVLDMMMPGMDGKMVFQELRMNAQTAGIPVIFMTAKVQQQEIEGYLKMGAAGVITKPFDPMKLSEELKAIFAEAQ
jgi:DNA-binding response OmpR family regulator